MKGLKSSGKATASPKSKVMASGKGGFAKGGNSHMAMKSGANAQQSGTSSPDYTPLSKSMAKGGKGKDNAMFPKQQATPALKGTSSPSNGRGSMKGPKN